MTTKIAVITDVHGDVHALRDALWQIDRLGVESDRIVCLGDIVDYGLFPDETIALLREQRITTIRGNHDRWAVDDRGRDASGWDLSLRSIEFLRRLPTSWRTVIDGVRVLAVHASPAGDMVGIDADAGEFELRETLKQAAADVLLVGHTHAPFVRRLRHQDRNRLVINPGALLRDAAPGVSVMTPGLFAIVVIERNREVKVEIRCASDGAVVIAR